MIAFILEENRKLRAETEKQSKDLQKRDHQIKMLH